MTWKPESFLNGKVELFCGDCLDILPIIAENAIDSVVCDPPYHLTNNQGTRSPYPGQYTPIGRPKSPKGGFMGKQWDGGDIAQSVDLWRQVYRVLKPGAYLLSMGGDRTYHRMACAIEDAGFEVRGTLAYIFGSGFPKSHNINKRLADEQAICTCGDALRQEYGEMRGVREDILAEHKISSEAPEASLLTPMQRDVSGAGLGETRLQGCSGEENIHADVRSRQSSVEGRGDLSESQGQLRQREVREMSAGIKDNGAAGWIRDGASASDGYVDWPSAHPGGVRSPSRSSAIKQSEGESGTMAVQSQPQVSGAWPTCGRCGKPIVPDGFGTALKPAMELVCMARKPLSEKTVAANVLRWGTGAINVDGCRVETGETLGRINNGRDNYDPTSFCMAKEERTEFNNSDKRGGRWPANVIHDGSEEVLAGFPEGRSAYGNQETADANVGKPYNAVNYIYGKSNERKLGHSFSDTGSAARFFYTAKADSNDRIGSRHPTVKPLDLMQYLVRLVTPQNGTVLDMFAGSGTTGEAAFREGMKAILIEKEQEYQSDIRRRMELCLSGPDERARQSIKAKMKDKPQDHGPLFDVQNTVRNVP